MRVAYDEMQRCLDSYLEATTGISRGTPEAHKNARKELMVIRDRVCDLKLIFIELSNEDDAYVIFETLNTRGKDLSLSDLAKNHFLRLIKGKNTDFDSVKLKWHNMVDVVSKSIAEIDMDSFLYHYWLSKYEFLTSKNVYKSIKKEVKSTNARAELNALDEDVKYYRALFEPQYGEWEKQHRERISRPLIALQLFKVTQPIPCLLSLIRAYRKDRLSVGMLSEALESIEHFHFIFTAITSQRSSGGISKMYSSLAIRIHDADTKELIHKHVRDLKTKLRERIPSYAEFTALFSNLNYTQYNSRSKKLVKYILEKIYMHKYGTKYSYEQMTIEHLAPQSGITSFEQSLSIGRIGNLLLMDKKENESKLKDRPPIDKLKILKTINHPFDTELFAHKEWGTDEIAHRTHELCKLAYESVWAIK